VIGNNLRKYFGEFHRYFTNHQYEKTPDGVYFPRAQALLAGVHRHWVTGFESDTRRDHNVIPYEGQNFVLGVAFRGAAQHGSAMISSWYLGLHSGTGVEDETVTAVTYDSTHSEIQAQSGDPGGYTSATRILWDEDTPSLPNSASELVNATTPAAFTVDTSTTLVVNGAWMTNKSGRTDYTGYAMSIAKFSATRNLADTDVFNLEYTIDLDHV
jgi:hypothetical protein